MDYADDLVLLTNTSVQVEYLLPSLEMAARSIGLSVKSEKTKFMSFKQDGSITKLSGELLKLVDHFTNLGSYISSTETDVNIYIGKAWTAIEKLSIIWKCDLPDKIGFLQC